MLTFTPEAPITVGSLGNQVTITGLQLTGINFTRTPELAPIGSGDLAVTLTDPATGFQETVRYLDASALELWSALESTLAQAVFAKLIADGKLPTGSVDDNSQKPTLGV